MKKIIILPALALVTLLATGCGKERNCECTFEGMTSNYNPVVVVDNGMKCNDIKEIAVEEKYVTEDGTHSLHRTEVHKVNCREQRQ